jgi:type I restriction enzyme S subunit
VVLLKQVYGYIGFERFGTGSGVPTLNRNDVHIFQVPLPTKEEQTAIAQILSDMDNDILALETQRNKTLAIKQGMMQELLTGKTRLI